MDWARIGLVLGLVVVVLLAVGGMWWGWRNRGRRQSGFPAPPAPPALAEPIGEPLTGLYVSTTTSGHWQDRIVAYQMGRRAQGSVELHAQGIQIERGVEDPVWIPREALVAVGTSPGTAGKVMGVPDGILLITWKWGDTAVDTGFRVDERDGQQDWIEAAQALLEGREVDVEEPEAEEPEAEQPDAEQLVTEEPVLEQPDAEEQADIEQLDSLATDNGAESAEITERKAAE